MALVVPSSLVFLAQLGFSAPKWPANALGVTGTSSSSAASEWLVTAESNPTPGPSINTGGTLLSPANAEKHRAGKPDEDVGPLTLTRDSSTDFAELPDSQSANRTGVGTARPTRNAEVVAFRESGLNPTRSRWGLLIGFGLVFLVCFWLFRASAARFG